MAKPPETNKNIANVIDGTSAGEHLNGGASGDTINGAGGDDWINAGSGNDTVNGGAGDDIIDGDSGDDVLVYVSSENTDGITRDHDTYIGGSGIDTLKLVLTAEENADPAVQQEIANFLAFIAANTLPNGQAKNVDFTFKTLNLTVNRVEKLDVSVANLEPDYCVSKFVINDDTVIINGTDEGETIIGGAGEETIFGKGGNDTIAGRDSNDQLSGGAGDDLLVGNRGDDLLCGGEGDDILLGNIGNDQVYGGKGNDEVRGGEDDDIVDGGDGDDLVGGDEGDDVLYGGKGNDTFLYGVELFNNDLGNDVIKDFELGGTYQDKIQIAIPGDEFDTYAEVIAAAQDTANGVLFDFGPDRSLLVENVTVAQLTSDYFVF